MEIDKLTGLKYVKPFAAVGIKDVGLVGGKTASLGEMYTKLSSQGINVPNGFAITAEAYRHLVRSTGVEEKIKETLSDLDTDNVDNLQERGRKCRELISNTPLPDDMREEIAKAYDILSSDYGTENTDVAVRSSATAEDLPDASFAGQQETYLNINGLDELVNACQRCFASLFTDRAIHYREDKGFGHFDVYLSIAVQKMVRSDSSSSGVMFSIDTESGFRDAVFITGSWGLGENVVQGAVNPDEFYVFKPILDSEYKPIIGKQLGEKAIKMVYADHGAEEPVKNVQTPEKDRMRYVLNDEEIIQLAKWAKEIEDHYTLEEKESAEKEGRDLPHDFLKPMDMEWAKDGDGDKVGTGKLFIVQARPETVHSQKERMRIKDGKKFFHLEHHRFKDESMLKPEKRLAEGRAVGTKIAIGKVNNIPSAEDIGTFKEGSILVTSMTDPDWEPIMKKAGAIVTDQGGRTCHAAIISRELGIPCIVGTHNGSEGLRSGMDVTISCVEGDAGYVYEGTIPFEIKDEWIEIPDTKTKIMMNAGIPEKAFDQGQIPNDGVGLAREEFIINSHIGIHPNALLNYDKIKEDVKGAEGEEKEKLEKLIELIEEKTHGYDTPVEYFIDKLARGISKIGAAFYPNDVIVRMSDFKTNEYANLIGGFLYEPMEHNPMIGWRGASRYYDKNFKKAFGLECKALLKARNVLGFTNIKAMIPFCRTPDEGKKVVSVMNEYGLRQGENDLEIYVMAEIPSNVIAADEFAEIFDGFSIGSNDLTQLALGLDRDSDLVQHIYDERNIAVKRLVKSLIETAKEKGRKVGICGQAPSDYPEFAEFLVECGIDSISLNPDTVLDTKLKIAAKEKEMGINP